MKGFRIFVRDALQKFLYTGEIEQPLLASG